MVISWMLVAGACFVGTNIIGLTLLNYKKFKAANIMLAINVISGMWLAFEIVKLGMGE
jgi:uncharacterized membrane-anchored protein YitT (DUF2179 family)